jgi:MFS family permease
MMAFRLGAGSLGGIVAGACASRVDRRRVMIGADVLQAMAMIVLVVGAAAHDVVVLAGVVVVLGVGSAMFTVALRTSVPEMAGQEARVRANGLLVTAKSFGTVAGFASAGVVITTGGVEAAFAVNAVSFGCSALALAFVRFRSGSTTSVVAGRMRNGKLFALLPAALLSMVVLRGIDALASSSHNVALPVLASTSHMADGAAFLSRFWVTWAAGMLLAHQLVKRWWRRRDPATGEQLFVLATGVMAVGFVLACSGLPALLVMCGALVAGLADGVAEIAYTSRLQGLPEQLRARLFGISTTVETSGFAIGMVVAGAALDVLPVLAVVAMFHGLALCAAVAFFVFGHLGEEKDDSYSEACAVHRTCAGTDR